MRMEFHKVACSARHNAVASAVACEHLSLIEKLHDEWRGVHMQMQTENPSPNDIMAIIFCDFAATLDTSSLMISLFLLTRSATVR